MPVDVPAGVPVDVPAAEPVPPVAPSVPAVPAPAGSNINVNVRIFSPGDNGPVNQTAGGGGGAGAAPAPVTWIWNWTWNGAPGCDPGAGANFAPAPGIATWTWNWVWTCGAADAPVGLPELPKLPAIDIASGALVPQIALPKIDIPGLAPLPDIAGLAPLAKLATPPDGEPRDRAAAGPRHVRPAATVVAPAAAPAPPAVADRAGPTRLETGRRSRCSAPSRP